LVLRSVILDTNVVISGLLVPLSLPAQVRMDVESRGILLASVETLAELEEVVRRPKFAKLVPQIVREDFLKRYLDAALIVPISSTIRGCRDSRDDKFLELAVDGKADVIVTGDQDLLVLDPFRGVRILSPRGYLEAAGAGPRYQ
jgi:uncharacterized protein